MGRLSWPLKTWSGRINTTLHGRSIYRKQNVSGHNVFKGYLTPGVGAAIDLFCTAREPVYTAHAGRISRWQHDATKLEVVYITGKDVVTVYAHIDFLEELCRPGGQVNAGQQIGVVRWDLKDPHLHWEVWVDGKAVAGSTPAELLRKLKALSQDEADQVSDWAAASWRKALVTDPPLTDGTRPHDAATREETIVMFDRLGLLD